MLKIKGNNMEEEVITMEQPNSEQAEITEVNEENIEKSTATGLENGSIGKFKDTESLLSAYNNLQAEFTRKCQKLSELESLQSQIAVPKINEEESIKNYIENNKELKDTILKVYLEGLQNSNSPAVISNSFGSGIPLKTPPKPKNLEEAREVVRNLFN